MEETAVYIRTPDEIHYGMIFCHFSENVDMKLSSFFNASFEINLKMNISGNRTIRPDFVFAYLS